MADEGGSAGEGGAAPTSPLYWLAYFPDEAYDSRDRRAELTEALCGFFATAAGFSLIAKARVVCRAGLPFRRTR